MNFFQFLSYPFEVTVRTTTNIYIAYIQFLVIPLHNALLTVKLVVHSFHLTLVTYRFFFGTETLFPNAGWAFADSVLHRLAPLWVGARGLEFTWDYILQGLEANANLVCLLS